MKKRKSREPDNVEEVEAILAKLGAAEQSVRDAAWEALHGRTVYPRGMRATVIRREQRRKRAATLDREVKARAAELERCGVRNPITQAEAEIAERWGHKNGAALNRWRRRNR